MEHLIKKIENRYGLQVYDYHPHLNVWCLDTSSGKKCLKKVRYPVQDAVFIWLATENLIKNGFTRFNRFLLTSTGEPYLETADGLHVVSEWITGKECDYTDLKALLIAVRNLAEMHQASQGFYPPPFARERLKWGYWIGNFAERLEELKYFKNLASRKRTFFDVLYHAQADIHISQAQEAIFSLENSAYYRLVEIESRLNSFCHHDYAHHNVIIKDDQGYLIDFDFLICDLRCHDIASLMIRAIKDNDWRTWPAEMVLKEYEDYTYLRPGERGVIYGFLKFPQEFWQAGYTYYIEQNRTSERMEKRLKSCVTAVDLRAKCIEELAEICSER